MKTAIICILALAIGYITYQIQLKKISIKGTPPKTVYTILDLYNKKLNELAQRNILHGILNKINSTQLVIVSLIIYLIVLYLFNKVIGILSASIILALPILISPYIIMNIAINVDKQKIMKILPTYIINLKNYVEQDNNIIKAIKQTMCEEPLKNHVDNFNALVQKGINIKIAFKKLKSDVNIQIFSGLVIAIEACNNNGGEFTNILTKYVEIISKENTNREKTKEKAYSSIIILVIMLIINIYLIFSFVFSNPEYSGIVKETTIGRIILDINAISYIAIGYIVLKIYRIGE